MNQSSSESFLTESFEFVDFISKRQKEELGELLLTVQSILTRNTSTGIAIAPTRAADASPIEVLDDDVDDEVTAAANQYKKYCTLYFTSGNAPTIPMKASFDYIG